MSPEKIELLNQAFNMYKDLIEKIKVMYMKSEEYIIATRPELDDVLKEADCYMHEVFNCLANASGGVSEEEQAFIDKLTIYNEKNVEVEADAIIGSTFDNVPKYIELANTVDEFAETDYARELVKDTLAICRKLSDIDGSTYADESSFTYSFIDMLEKYIKDKRKRA